MSLAEKISELGDDFARQIASERDHSQKWQGFLCRAIYQLMARQGLSEFEVPPGLPLVHHPARKVEGSEFEIGGMTIDPNVGGMVIMGPAWDDNWPLGSATIKITPTPAN